MNTIPAFSKNFQYPASPEEKIDRPEFLLSQASVTIYTCMPEGVFGITYLSDHIKELLGYNAEDFLSNSEFYGEMQEFRHQLFDR